MERQTILNALETFAESRPGIDLRNYGGGMDGWRAYRSESRSVTRDLKHARILLRAVERSSITAEAFAAAFRDAYAGRLALTYTDNSARLDYCTGQYYPTEYRRAVCAVLSSALWHHYRDDMAAGARPGESAGDAIRRGMRRVVPAHVARVWFN